MRIQKIILVSLFSFSLFVQAKDIKKPNKKNAKTKTVSLKSVLPFKDNKRLKILKSRSSGLISQRVYKQLSRAYDLSSSKKYKQAIQTLVNYSGKSRLRKGERAELLRNIGLLYAQKGGNKQAENYLKQALNTKSLSYLLHLSVMYNLAQLSVSQENYAKTKKILEEWFSINDNPNPQGYVLLAICYSEAKQLDEALTLVDHAIKISSSPQESWLKFALSLYIRKQNYEKSQSLLERLVAQFPSQKQYWKQLSGVYLRLNQSKKALVTLELAEKMGYLKTKTDYLTLSGLYINEEIPLAGAKILDQKIKQKVIPAESKNLKLRAEAYWIARENKKAMKFFKQAVQLAQDEKIYVTYGNLLIQEEEWDEAESIFKKAESFASSQIKKENKNSFAKVYLGLGMALYHQEKYKKALDAFRRSFELNSDLSSAFHWIQYTETALSNHSAQ